MTIVFLRPICRSTQQDSIRWQATCILQGTASFGQDRHIWFCIHCLLLFHTYNLITERKIWPQITWRWRLTKTSTGPDRPTDLHSIEIIWWFHEPERKKNWRKHSLGPGIVGTPKVSLRSMQLPDAAHSRESPNAFRHMAFHQKYWRHLGDFPT